MKTTQQINRIKTLKRLIAEMVDGHKSTKEIARMSSNDAKYNSWNTSYAQASYTNERQRLFVAYTLIHMLRHDIENVEEYAEEALSKLTTTKKTEYEYRRWPVWIIPEKGEYGSKASLKDSLESCLTRLDSYIAEHTSEEQSTEDGQQDKRLYVLISDQLEPIYGAVQGGHAIAQWLIEHSDNMYWKNNTVVYLSCDIQSMLRRLKDDDTSIFREPDLGNIITAIAVVETPYNAKVFKKLKLLH